MSGVRRFLVAGAAVAALVGMVPVASHATDCTGETTEVGGYYAQDRGVGSIWVYEESNGIEGLQLGGVSATGLSDDTHCQGVDAEGNDIPADTLIL